MRKTCYSTTLSTPNALFGRLLLLCCSEKMLLFFPFLHVSQPCIGTI